MHAFGRSALALLSLVAGCGNQPRPPEQAHARAAQAVARVRAQPSFARSLSSAPPIVRHGEAYLAQRVELPASADGPTRFVDGSLTLRALDTAASEGLVIDSALAYADVAPETDLVVHAVPSGFEELRVLRGPRAPHEFRWSVESRGSLRVVSGRVEVLDEHGVVRVRSEPAYALDAAGARRDLSLHLERPGVLVAALDTAGLRYPIVVDPTWLYVVSPLGNFYGYAWVQPTSSLVLQLGGSNNSTDGTATFDVPTETWTPHFITGSYHTYCEAIWLPSIGKTLIVGGRNGGGGYQNDAMLYSTTPTPSGAALSATMTVGRAFHSLTLITVSGSERVLIVGGGDGTISTEIFDPSTSTFVARTPMTNARTKHAATLLASGKVLVTGGRPSTSSALSNAEVYDPAANGWVAAGNTMANARYDHRQARLADGRVLVVGGTDNTGTVLDSTSIYDPTSNTFSAGPKLGSARTAFSLTELPSGKLLVAGGTGTAGNLSTTELYDPATNTFSAGPTMNAARTGHRAALLSGGRVLVGSGATASTEILWPDATTCSGTSATCPYCVDGVCCDSACTGQCDACDLPGKKGVCSPVSGEAPHGTRAACSPFAVCVYDSAKASSACATSCASDAACAAGSYCVSPGASGTCAPKQADGAGCGASNTCLSGVCADGVCCKTACTGQCDSCAEPGSLGTCTKVDGMPRGTRPACTAPYACSAGVCATTCTKDAECATGRTCDVASGTCVPKKGNGSACTSASQCVSGQCVDGTCCNSDCTNPCFACDLAGKGGTCSALEIGQKPHGTRSCAPYAVCGAGGACPASCTSGADCISGTCDSATSTCAAPSGDAGTETGTDAGTETGSDIGVADGAAPDPGPKPSVGEFIKCNKPSDCATGFCVEGVCCDSACEGRCHSCALLTSPGRCVAEPLGVDLKNECGPALACVGTCDGTGECIGAGTGTMCSRNRCTGASTGAGPAYCPAPGGKCATADVVPFDCAPYVCEPAFGACVTSCRSSADCANGFVCDVGAKACVAPPPPDSSGGCSVSPPAEGSGRLGLFALLGLVLVGASRRRARSWPRG